MFFKNKETGLIWEVTHEAHIKRCMKDPNYEEAVEPKKDKSSKKDESLREDKPKQPKEKPVKKK
jgi:hypothetical protein